MPRQHPIKAIRLAVVESLRDAAISIDVKGVPKAVTVLDFPPENGLVDESKLPGIFCFTRSERIEASANSAGGVEDTRDYLIDVVLQCGDYAANISDQVDDLHLALEDAISASDRFTGLVHRIRPTGSETLVERGEISFASRRVTYLASRNVNRRDPAITT